MRASGLRILLPSLAFEPGLPVAYDIDLTALSLLIAVALTWLVPDRRVERHLSTAPVEPSE